jgi:EF hand domain-containing protein
MKHRLALIAVAAACAGWYEVAELVRVPGLPNSHEFGYEACTASEGGSPPESTERDMLHVIVFSAERPVFLRLHVLVDGKPYRDAFESAWNDYLEHLFRYLDRDGDGALVSEEAEAAPAPSAVLPGGFGGDQPGVHFAFNFRVFDRDGDGKVTPAELAAYYRRYAGGPFHARLVTGPATRGDR